MIEVISVGSVVMLPQIKKIFVYLKPKKFFKFEDHPNFRLLPPLDYLDVLVSPPTYKNEYYGKFVDELKEMTTKYNVRIDLPSTVKKEVNEFRYQL